MLNMVKLLLVMGVFFFVAFFFLSIHNAVERFRNDAELIIYNAEMSEDGFNDELLDGVNDEIDFYISNDIGGVIYSNLDYSTESIFGIFKIMNYVPGDNTKKLIIRDKMQFYKGIKGYTIEFYYNITDDYNRIKSSMLLLIGFYILLSIGVIITIRRENIEMLSPLKKMSETLERLSIKNIHSERLNINISSIEIQDLSIICNEMLDRLETSYESQKQFVSNASHELRTPIAVIQGYANMLNRWGAEDPEILKESIEAICNVSQEMKELVEKLLFLSRHDRRTLKLKKDWFDMKIVIEDLLKETELVVKNRIIKAPVIMSAPVFGDSQMLKQAVRVFIDNAVKYTEDGDTISISCRDVRGDCEIVIEDTGIGMKRKDLDNIFERFYRSDDVRNRNISGHGLGLSIAKLIIISHNGRINIRTQYTHGTSFTITIPKKR